MSGAHNGFKCLAVWWGERGGGGGAECGGVASAPILKVTTL